MNEIVQEISIAPVCLLLGEFRILQIVVSPAGSQILAFNMQEFEELERPRVTFQKARKQVQMFHRQLTLSEIPNKCNSHRNTGFLQTN